MERSPGAVDLLPELRRNRVVEALEHQPQRVLGRCAQREKIGAREQIPLQRRSRRTLRRQGTSRCVVRGSLQRRREGVAVDHAGLRQTFRHLLNPQPLGNHHSQRRCLSKVYASQDLERRQTGLEGVRARLQPTFPAQQQRQQLKPRLRLDGPAVEQPPADRRRRVALNDRHRRRPTFDRRRTIAG